LLIETSISKNIESPLPTLPEDASELAADQNPFVQEAAAASPQQQPVARQSDATGNIAAELTEESTVSAQTEEVVTDIQPTRTIALETDSETTTNQTQHESEESSVHRIPKRRQKQHGGRQQRLSPGAECWKHPLN
jgi:hypothetical protein